MESRKRILIGCDNAGVGLKEVIKRFVIERGYEVEDVGVRDEQDNTYYPLIAREVAERIIASGYSQQGILICGTGIGMAMTANKFPGIFASVCHDNFSAER